MFHTQQAISLSLEMNECRQKIACNTLCLAEYEVPPTPHPTFSFYGIDQLLSLLQRTIQASPRSGVRFLNSHRLAGWVVWVLMELSLLDTVQKSVPPYFAIPIPELRVPNRGWLYKRSQLGFYKDST